MAHGRTFRIALAALAGAGTAAVIIFLNLALLGYAQSRDEPVGKLSPQAPLLTTPVPGPTPGPEQPVITAGENDD